MRNLAIAYGGSCHAKQWSNKTITFDELCERLKTTVRTPETVAEYQKMKKSDRELAKDKGGFVGGQLAGGRRKNESIISRSMLTLDADSAPTGFIDLYCNKAAYASCLYTTHSHTSESVRVRIIIPLTRDVTPEEYIAVSRYFANDWCIDYFDICSYKPNQLMYWPTTPSDGEYVFKRTEGEWLNPDEVLKKHPEWRDISLLPTCKKESAAKANVRKKQKDPLEKKGVVGAYCRAHTITEIMEQELSDIYAPSANGSGRYDYIKGESTAGVVVYDDKFAYSHHATDPAGGMLLNAFDLVRVHRFGDDFSAMNEYALKDNAVKAQLLKDRQDTATEEFTDWHDRLSYEKNGTLVSSLSNLLIILENDELINSISYNLLSNSVEIKDDVPWVHGEGSWRDADDAQLACYIEEKYGSFSARNLQTALTKVADDRKFHPIREFLEKLPPWDGISRVDTLYIDYLGAEDNEYTRAVARKALCAAYKRVYEPGIKFDTMTVFNGPQGKGKSTLIARLGGTWYTDSVSLTDMNDKTAAEKLQGYWFIEIGEMAGMKKADLDRMKAFVSRLDDKYRASFGRYVTSHPRQCIFFGTTNAIDGYLRDITGNRRFWPVRTPGGEEHHPWELTKYDIEQIWAEVKELAKTEDIVLPRALEKYAERERQLAMETDEREGLVREYLETLLPSNWENMSLFDRRDFLENPDSPMHPEGTAVRSNVCNMEIWCECFGNRKEDIRKIDSYAIAAIMSRIDGWSKPDNFRKYKLYGRQRVYNRVNKP